MTARFPFPHLTLKQIAELERLERMPKWLREAGWSERYAYLRSRKIADPE